MTTTIIASIFGASSAIVALVIWFVSDRRKSKVEAEVAQATAPSAIEKADIDAADARLLYVQRQMDMERTFHQQQLGDRDAEIERQRAELERRDRRIAALLEQVDALQKQLDDATHQMTSIRTQLNELASSRPRGGA